MPPPESPAEDPPGTVQFRGTTKSSTRVADPDTAVIVTDEAVAAHPLPSGESDSPVEFMLPLNELQRLQCEGFMCRSVLLESETATYEVPTMGLDEGAFRRAIVQHSDLGNTCVRLNLDRLGVCPCEVGTQAGCAVCVLGVALMLSVVGALLGAGLLVVGLAVLCVAFAARKAGKWRGANVWERPGEEADVAG